MKRTTGLIVLLSLSLLLLTACSGGGGSQRSSGDAKSGTANVAPSSGCKPGSIAVGAKRHTTGPSHTPVTLIGGKCFDTIAYAGVGVSREDPTDKAVFNNFCSKLGFDDQLSAFLGHGYVQAVTSSLMNGSSQVDSGECVYSPQNDLVQALVGYTSNRISIEWSANVANSSGPQDALDLYDQQVESFKESGETGVPVTGVGDEASSYSTKTGVGIAADVGNGDNSVYVQVFYIHYGKTGFDISADSMKPWAVKALALSQDIHGTNN